MIKYPYIRLIILPVFSVIISCNRTDNPKIIANKNNREKFIDSNKEKDAQFVVDAVEINLYGIYMAKLAQQNSIRVDIRETGKLIEHNYNQSLIELTKIAGRKTITIPEDITYNKKRTINKLSYEIADDFDEKYLDQAINDHKDAIIKYENAYGKVSDTDIKIWIEGMLPMLRRNLDALITNQQRHYTLNKIKS